MGSEALAHYCAVPDTIVRLCIDFMRQSISIVLKKMRLTAPLFAGEVIT